MKIKVEPMPFYCSSRNVKIKLSEKSKWVDFGAMNHVERAELAEQLRKMAKELLKVD